MITIVPGTTYLVALLMETKSIWRVRHAVHFLDCFLDEKRILVVMSWPNKTD